MKRVNATPVSTNLYTDKNCLNYSRFSLNFSKKMKNRGFVNQIFILDIPK